MFSGENQSLRGLNWVEWMPGWKRSETAWCRRELQVETVWGTRSIFFAVWVSELQRVISTWTCRVVFLAGRRQQHSHVQKDNRPFATSSKNKKWNDSTVSSADQKNQMATKKKNNLHCTSGSALFRKRKKNKRLSSTDTLGFSVATPSAGRKPTSASSRRLGQLNDDTFTFLVTFTNNNNNNNSE